jgi:hypothetical protein
VDHQAFRLGLVGLPEKEFIEDPIYEHILRGEEDLVAEYCKLDCLDTLLLYLLWALHCGQLEESEMREHVKLIRRELEPEPAWTDIAERLEEWRQQVIRRSVRNCQTPAARLKCGGENTREHHEEGISHSLDRRSRYRSPGRDLR